MIKRVSLVAALLFANIAFGQSATSVTEISNAASSSLDTPVVMDLSATGMVTQTGSTTATTSDDKVSPAEISTSTGAIATSTGTTTETGAFGTSTGSTTISTTTIETEESTTKLTAEQKQRLFNLVYEGFQEFVRITLGWE